MPETTPNLKPAKTAHKRWRRALIALGVFLIVSLGVLFMLPIWASSEQGRQYALEQMNRKLNGTLKIRSWSLGWFSPIRMEGIELDTKEGVPVLECDHLQTGLTLWGWYWGNYDLGTTLLSGVRIRTTRYTPGDTDFHHILGLTPAPSPPSSPSNTPPTAANPPALLADVWNSMRGSIRIEDGHIELATDPPSAPPSSPSTSSSPPIQINNITAEIPIASPMTSIHLTLTGESFAAGKSARIEVTGDLPPITNWRHDPAALLRQLTIHAGALPTQTLAAWLGLDAFSKTGWEDSLGPTADIISFESKPEGATRALCALQMHAANSDLRARVRMDWTDGNTTLILHSDDGHYARATARLGNPVLKMLGYINPLLAQGLPNQGAFGCAINESRWVLGNTLESQVEGLVTLKDLQLRRAGLLEQIEQLNRPEKSTRSLPPAIPATIPTMRVTISKARVNAEPVVVELPDHPRMVFTGSVGLDGSVDLLMTLPLTEGAGSLTAGTARVPMGGTVEKPELEKSGF